MTFHYWPTVPGISVHNQRNPELFTKFETTIALRDLANSDAYLPVNRTASFIEKSD